MYGCILILVKECILSEMTCNKCSFEYIIKQKNSKNVVLEEVYCIAYSV